MSSFYTYNCTENDLSQLSNQVKEHLAEAMRKEGLITDDQCREVKELYAVIITRKSWLGAAWDKLRGVSEDKGMHISIVKDLIVRNK